MQDTDWRINAFSVFLCRMVIERFGSGAFTQPDQGYKLSLRTTNMATRAADCHSKLNLPGFIAFSISSSSPLIPYQPRSLLSPLYLFNHISLFLRPPSPTSQTFSTNHFIALLCLDTAFISPLFLSGVMADIEVPVTRPARVTLVCLCNKTLQAGEIMAPRVVELLICMHGCTPTGVT